MEELNQTLRSLHACYCTESGETPPYQGCERRLLEFHKQGYALDELALTIRYVKMTNRSFGNGVGFSLRFGKLFQQAEDGIFEHFSDLLGSARAWKRKMDFKAKHSYPPAKAEVLRATGRPDTIPLEEPKPAKEIVYGMLKKGFEDALKEAEESVRFKP